MLRQIIYASERTGDGSAAEELRRILEQSRHNNALDGVTGLLWSDGRRFMQVLEGPEDSVGPTYSRIAADPRHRDVALLSDRSLDEREFGYWSMAVRGRGDAPGDPERLMRRRLEGASAEVRDAFEGLLATVD